MKKVKRLSDMPNNAKALFMDLEGASLQRLRDMGLLPGEMIRVVYNTGHGPVTIALKGTTVAIGHGLARKILVKEI